MYHDSRELCCCCGPRQMFLEYQFDILFAVCLAWDAINYASLFKVVNRIVDMDKISLNSCDRPM